ncbi:MAG TPA: MGMT family protein [Candidatus Obscuribacterales bacterium]
MGVSSASMVRSRSGSGTTGGVYARVYDLVRKIPRGKVLTYGLVSTLLGGPLSAQGVGWALRALPNAGQPGGNRKRRRAGAPEPGSYSSADVPWHRVVNSAGALSTHKNPGIEPGLQQLLLEQEGVFFHSSGKLDLDKYLWWDGLTAATPAGALEKTGG